MARYLPNSLYLNSRNYYGSENTDSKTFGASSDSQYYVATRRWVYRNFNPSESSYFEFCPETLGPNQWTVYGVRDLGGGHFVWPKQVSLPSGRLQGIRYCDDNMGNSWGGQFTQAAGSDVGLGSEGGFYIAQRVD